MSATTNTSNAQLLLLLLLLPAISAVARLVVAQVLHSHLSGGADRSRTPFNTHNTTYIFFIEVCCNHKSKLSQSVPTKHCDYIPITIDDDILSDKGLEQILDAITGTQDFCLV